MTDAKANVPAALAMRPEFLSREGSTAKPEAETQSEAEPEVPEPQARAVEALVTGATLTAAAERAGVSRGTVYRWHQDPQFVAALNRAKRDHRAEVSGELRSLTASAVRVLREVLESSDQSAANRIRVALGVLRAVGADRPEALGPTRAEDLERAWEDRGRGDLARLEGHWAEIGRLLADD